MGTLTFTVVCRSCDYWREWPTAQEAIDDGLRHEVEEPDHQPSALPPPASDSNREHYG